MVAVKNVADVASKWASVTPGRAQFYEQGVRNPRQSWSQAAGTAAGNYRAAVSQGDIEAKFKSGIQKAGDAKWQRGATTKGTQRFGPGVQAAAGDFSAAVEPYLSTIAATQLPARQPRGSPANLQRVNTLATALAAKRQQMRGAGRA